MSIMEGNVTANILYEEFIVCSKPHCHFEARKLAHCSIIP